MIRMTFCKTGRSALPLYCSDRGRIRRTAIHAGHSIGRRSIGLPYRTLPHWLRALSGHHHSSHLGACESSSDVARGGGTGRVTIVPQLGEGHSHRSIPDSASRDMVDSLSTLSQTGHLILPPIPPSFFKTLPGFWRPMTTGAL